MNVSILTLFPEMVAGALRYSIVGRAIKQKLLEINFINIRDFGIGLHKQVDDRPYGGGVGMVMRVDVLSATINYARHPELGSGSLIQKIKEMPKQVRHDIKEKIILLDPKGKLFNQSMARRFSKLDHLILICGHYEGVDHRVAKLVDESVSIGQYILTGGEIPAMVIVDAVTRLLPGVLSKPEATLNESFQLPTSHFPHPTLEYPQYTRPSDFKNMKVPKILLSGNHKKIEEWRKSH